MKNEQMRKLERAEEPVEKQEYTMTSIVLVNHVNNRHRKREQIFLASFPSRYLFFGRFCSQRTEERENGVPDQGIISLLSSQWFLQ